MHRIAARLASAAALIGMITAVVGSAVHSPLHHLLACGSCAVAHEHCTDEGHHGHSHSHVHGCPAHQQHGEDVQDEGTPADSTPHEHEHDCSLCQLLAQSALATQIPVLALATETVALCSTPEPENVRVALIAAPPVRGPPLS